MNHLGFLLAAHCAVCDNRFYQSEWNLMIEFAHCQESDVDLREMMLSIIADDDNKISIDQVIQELLKTNIEEQAVAICLAMTVASIVNGLSEEEDDFLHDVAKKLDIKDKEYSVLKNLVCQSIEMVGDIITIKPLKESKKLFPFISGDSISIKDEAYSGSNGHNLLSGEEYFESIKQMRTIAKEDIKFVQDSFDKVIKSCENGVSRIDKQFTLNENDSSILSNLDKKSKDETESLLSNIQNNLLDDLFLMEDTAAEALRKKEESIEHFTVSFMGRTKAGKSTLHSILLKGSADEFIGIGKTRTTRFNRIYRWNGLEIVDTPGIGAVGGEDDAKIAASIIDESDMICYLVTTDSIQETEFNFLKILKDQNKPVLIVLNNKDNFTRDEDERNDFIQDPLDWYTRKGNKDIQGHIDRINEYVNMYYDNRRIEICPVHLLAAKEANKATDPEIKEALLKGSRIDAFIEIIRNTIIRFGTIKRSQTIIDGSAFYLNRYISNLGNDINSLKKQIKALEKSRRDSRDRINRYSEQTSKNIENVIKGVYNNFIASKIPYFALSNREYDSDVINRNLTALLKEERFHEGYIERIKTEWLQFQENVRLTVELANVSFKSSIDPKVTHSFSGGNTKKTVEIAGGVLDLVGCGIATSNPIGFGILAVGVAMNILGGIFIDSKSKKLAEAEEHLRIQLTKKFTASKDETVAMYRKDTEKAFKKIKADIWAAFGSSILQLKTLVSELEKIKQTESLELENLNKLYGARIVNFLYGSKVYDLTASDGHPNINVDREYGKHISITSPHIFRVDTSEISKVLQEEITINE